MKLSYLILYVIFLTYSISDLLLSMEKEKSLENVLEEKEKKPENYYKAPHSYSGTLPVTARITINAVCNPSLPSKFIPCLIKVFGAPGVGKTTFIDTLAQTLYCKEENYLKIENVKKISSEVLDKSTAKTLPSKKNPTHPNTMQKHIHAVMKDFYTKNIGLCVIAFTKELPLLQDAEKLKKLKKFLDNLKTPKKHLLVFHETQKLLKEEDIYYDEIIRIDIPSSLERTKTLLNDIFQEEDCKHEAIADKTIWELYGKRPPSIRNIVQRAARIAYSKKSDCITNDHILEARQLHLIDN